MSEATVSANLQLTWLDRSQAAAYCRARGLRLSKATLEKWAQRGAGPTVRKFGRWPVYSPQELDAWIASRLAQPKTTNEAA